MSRVFAYLLRFAHIILGYAAASLAASAFINVVFLGSQDWKPEEIAVVSGGALIFSIPFVALFVAYFAFMPAAVLILAAEIFSRRDWLTYALAGGATGVVVVGYFRQAAEEGYEAVNDPFILSATVAAGVIGGLAYWLVCGRYAGGWYAARPQSIR